LDEETGTFGNLDVCRFSNIKFEAGSLLGSRILKPSLPAPVEVCF
jgi:hypothetical protein